MVCLIFLSTFFIKNKKHVFNLYFLTVRWSDRLSVKDRFIYTKRKILNKCWTLSPPMEIPDNSKETKSLHLIQQKSGQARDVANAEMKQGFV